jgi:hypothetical protein
LPTQVKTEFQDGLVLMNLFENIKIYNFEIDEVGVEKVLLWLKNTLLNLIKVKLVEILLMQLG